MGSESYADLHIHSCCSDGTMTVEQIVAETLRNGVHTIAVTDHNTMKAIGQLETSCHQGLEIIPGVELDAAYDGVVFHILGYFIDPGSRELAQACEHNERQQELLNRKLVERMSADHVDISVEEYDRSSYDRSGGGWKLLHYLLDHHYTNRLIGGTAYYREYGLSPIDAGFLTVGQAVSAIKGARGIPILAHPGETIAYPIGTADFQRAIDRLLDCGIEGIECWHPAHSLAGEAFLDEHCRARGLYTSGGSDFHGDFFGKTKQRIGGQFVRERDVADLLSYSGKLGPI